MPSLLKLFTEPDITHIRSRHGRCAKKEIETDLTQGFFQKSLDLTEKIPEFDQKSLDISQLCQQNPRNSVFLI